MISLQGAFGRAMGYPDRLRLRLCLRLATGEERPPFMLLVTR